MGFWLMPEPEALHALHGLRAALPGLDAAGGEAELSGEQPASPPDFRTSQSPLIGYPPIGQVQLWNETGPPQMTDEHLRLLKRRQAGVFRRSSRRTARKAGIAYWELWLSFHGPDGGRSKRSGRRPSGISRQSPARSSGSSTGSTCRWIRQRPSEYHEPEFGIPSLRAFSIGARTPWNPTPSKGHMWFSPIIPRTGEAIIEANRVFSEAAKSLGNAAVHELSRCPRASGNARSSSSWRPR